MISTTGALARVRDFAPYFVVEPLLPGGALVALLLWLSRHFIRNGLRDVRQHLHDRGIETPVVQAKAPANSLAARLCVRRCAVVRVLRNGFRRWCESVAAQRQGCALMTGQ